MSGPGAAPAEAARFVVARHPDPGARLPYLVRLPVAGEPPVLLACREPWPGAKDVYCHPLAAWPAGAGDADVVEEVAVRSCRRRGNAVHLVLERARRRRSLFVWTGGLGRGSVFWRTPATVQAARPGVRVPLASGLERPLEIAVDTRERYPWRFGRLPVSRARRSLPAGDYGVFVDDLLVAVVERKRVDDLVSAAVDGRLGFQLAELSRMPRAVVVVEGRFAQLFKGRRVKPGWLMNVVAALQVSHPGVSWMFADSRDLAQSFAFRWLAAARRAHLGEPVAPLPAAGVREGPQAFASQLPLPVFDRHGRVSEAARLGSEGTVWTTAAYAERFGVTRHTARADLRLLVDQGELEALGTGRGRRYARPRGAGEAAGGNGEGTGGGQGAGGGQEAGGGAP